MKFSKYVSFHQIHQIKTPPKIWYANPPFHFLDQSQKFVFELQAIWYKNRRPFFNVWPAIIPALLRVKFRATLDQFQLPSPVVTVHIPPHSPVEPFTAALIGVNAKPGKMTLFIEAQGPDRRHLSEIRVGPEHHLDDIIADGWHESNPADPTPPDTVNIIRLCLAVCLLANDPEVITPIVLAADLRKYEETKNPALVAKARRRGRFGWNIGGVSERCPHYRREHWRLAWTGKGRIIQTPVRVKGHKVKGRRLTAVPTGYLDAPAQKKEP